MSTLGHRPPGGRVGGRHQLEGPLDDREVSQPEEVHLEQPEVLDGVHLVLGDDLGAIALRWIGMCSVSGTGEITTAAAWIESWRRSPSRPRATSATLLMSGSVA